MYIKRNKKQLIHSLPGVWNSKRTCGEYTRFCTRSGHQAWDLLTATMSSPIKTREKVGELMLHRWGPLWFLFPFLEHEDEQCHKEAEVVHESPSTHYCGRSGHSLTVGTLVVFHKDPLGADNISQEQNPRLVWFTLPSCKNTGSVAPVCGNRKEIKFVLEKVVNKIKIKNHQRCKWGHMQSGQRWFYKSVSAGRV